MTRITAELKEQHKQESGGYADVILANLFEDTILLLENGDEREDPFGGKYGPVNDYF